MNDDGSIKAQKMDVAKIVPLLVASVQELSAKVTELENKLGE
jgi:outer membrane murein-binding lipoprotein Lpp